MKRTLSILTLTLFVPLLLAVGCDDDDASITDPSNETTVMFVNASPGPEQIDILVGGTEHADGLGFRDNTGYQPVDAGDRVLTVQFDDQPVPVLDSLSVSLSGLEVYSVFSGDTGTATTLLLVQDELNTPDTNGILVRLVNLSPNAGSVDLIDVDTDSIVGDASNVAYLSATPFELESADQYQFRVERSGTDDTLAVSTLNIYEAGKIYTLVLTGYDGGIGDEALAVNRILNQ